MSGAGKTRERRKSPLIRYSRKLRRILRRAADRFANGEPVDLGDIAHPVAARDALELFAAGQHDVFLLQIGANDGTSTDPVNTILRRGGVKACLVEPQPPVFAKLTETYAGTEHVSFENAAIGTSDGEQSLYVLDSEKFSAAGMYLDNLTGIASFERSHIVEHVARAAKNNIGFGHGISADDFVRETKVATITIETLLTRHAIEHMDILVTDCEGYDFEILKQIDFERFNLGLVVFEHVNLPASERFACWRMLKENGYTITVTDEDTVAYRNIGKRSRTNP